MKRFIKLLIVFIVTLFLTNTGYAHEVIILDEPGRSMEDSFEIHDIEGSKAIYSVITQEGQIDYYTFKGERGQVFYSQIMVPDTQEDRDFLLYKMVVGPFDDRIPIDFQDLVPMGLGGYVVPPGNNNTNFFEPFTQTSYIKKQQFLMGELPQDGQYYIIVFNPFGQTGRYILNVGTRERISISEILRLPITWFRVNYWFNPLRPFSVLILLAIVIFALYKIIRRVKNRRRFY